MARVDLGEDKNYIAPDHSAAYTRGTSSLMLEDLPKNSDEALHEARKGTWINWINSEPLLVAHMDEEGSSYLFSASDSVKNRVILLDFWDFTLLPCRRTLSYILEWNRRYVPAGLLTIGIHTPFFSFGRDKKNVLDAAQYLGITYPVVMDNEYLYWRALENRYWPRRVLLDAKGNIAFDVIGEEGYPQMERKIQALLRQLSPGLASPTVMAPVRAMDQPGYVAKLSTPDVFFGLKRDTRVGNSVKPSILGEEIVYQDEGKEGRVPDAPYLEGAWTTNEESLSVSIPVIMPNQKKEFYKGPQRIMIDFNGTEAYLVAQTKPKTAGDIPQAVKLQVFLDNKPLPEDYFGADCYLNDLRKSEVLIRDPRLYEIAKNLDYGTHQLAINVDPGGSDTVEIFAMFFESSV